jgi:hypothetical protein
MSQNGTHGIVWALRHLNDRLPDLVAADSRARPRWRQDDIDALSIVLERAASREQIALGRIEGVSHIAGSWTSDHKVQLKLVNQIARLALGLKVAA